MRKHLRMGLGLLLAFALWTVLILLIDVQAAGPGGTEIGFASINLWFHRLTGVHRTLYAITDWLGLVPIAVCLGFGDKPVWNHHRLVTGLPLSVAGTAVFIVTRQPYAGIVCLTILVIKGFLIWERKNVP